MNRLILDVRYAFRVMVRSPGFTSIAILTLAIGIGANTAIFSVVDSVLLEPLPYVDPHDLVVVSHENRREGNAAESMSYDTFRDVESQATTLGPMAAVSPIWSVTLAGGEEPERLSAQYVSAPFFPLLGVAPRLGRPFLPEEDRPGTALAIVLSDRLWRHRFGADPGVVGVAVTIEGASATVVGVMPPGFRFLDDVDLWMPLSHNSFIDRGRAVRFVNAAGRLTPGYGIEEASSEMSAIMGRLEQEYPETNTDLGATVRRLHDVVVGSTRSVLLVLLGVVGSVLLIACANVASLQMARATGRTREISLRAALGAGRLRLIRQLITESVVLALAGGAGGLLVGFWSLDLIRSRGPEDLPRLAEISMDGSVLTFATVVSLLTGVLFGLAPALAASRVDLRAGLSEGGRAAAPAGGRLRRVLVVVEVALALILLAGAGLMIRSLGRLLAVDPGFRADHLLTMQIMGPGDGYRDPQRRVNLYRDLFERIEALPGVEAAGGTTRLPMKPGVTTALEIEGRPVPEGERPQVEFRRASPRYLAAMGIPMLAGRFFSDDDDLDAAPVMIVNEAAAERFWPGEDPVGRHARPFSPSPDDPWWKIIGVVGNVHHFGLDQEPRPEIYISFHQGPPSNPHIAIRTATAPTGHVAAVRAAIRSVDPAFVIYGVDTMENLIDGSLTQRRFNTLLLGLFAATALILAVTGIYGVVSFSVRQRTHEIGVRMALGAGRGEILGMMLRDGVGLTAVGVLLGLGGGLALTRTLAGLLFGVPATDPATFAGVAALLVTVAALACYVPARRATRIEPMRALRYE